MSIDWQNLLKQGGVTAAQMAILNQGKQDLGSIPGQVRQGAEDVMSMAQPYTTFKPFTVTTSQGGTSTLGPQGLTMGLGSQQQQMVDSLQQQAIQQAGMIGQVTPEALMSQMQALRATGQQQEQLNLENRLAAQGRLGVQTAAYGGTPEQLAMQKAIQSQQSADSLAAIQGARTLQQQDTNNVLGMLNLANVPEQQMLQALTPAIQTQQIGAGLNQTQANLIGQLGQQYISEIPGAAKAQAGLSQAQAQMLMGMLGGSSGQGGSSNLLGDLISGLFGGSGGGSSIDVGNISAGVGNLFGDTTSWLGNLVSSGGDTGFNTNYGATMDSFTSGLNYDPSNPYGDLNIFGPGGGVNLPATVTGPGGI
jgi:hypothetical protein